ncbi:MAG: hypothetical protein R3C68_04760 [Myxococcota bacterium]
MSLQPERLCAGRGRERADIDLRQTKFLFVRKRGGEGAQEQEFALRCWGGNWIWARQAAMPI